MNTRNKASKKAKESPTALELHRGHIKLLLSDPRFKEAVQKVRGQLGIPPEGFYKEEDVALWIEKQDEEDDRILFSPELEERIRKINKDFEAQNITSQQRKDLLYEAHLAIPTNYKNHAVREIIKDFNLPENYKLSLNAYVVNNYFPLPKHFSFSYDKEKRGIAIHIYTRLTDEDLKEIKKFVNTVYKKKLPQMLAIKDLDTRLAVEKLLQEKYEFDEATGETYKLKNKDIAERVLKGSSKKGAVYEAQRSLKRLRKVRFTPSEKS